MDPRYSSFRRQGRPVRRRGHNFLKLILVLAGIFLVLNVGLTPWVFHIGGRFTPLTEWSGFGPVQASNGGRYELFTQIQGGLIAEGSSLGGCDQFSGCDDLQGSAKLCTENGSTYTFDLSGQVHTWLSTNGARTSLDLTGGKPRELPFLIDFSGKWHGPVLRVANPDHVFTEVFTPRGVIRSTTSTADDGNASATIAFGSAAGFARACKALTA